MLRRVKKYIDDHHLLLPNDRVLVCVSGGADSVALLDVLLRAGYECAVANCNFHLRNKESDRDTEFVKQLVGDLAGRLQIKKAWMQNGIPLYIKDFDTRTYAEQQHLSIETAARELRYRWFDEIARQTDCKAIAVAHHQNDQAETILMHIRRGCGIKGLCGMRPIAPNPCLPQPTTDNLLPIPVIRPLLCTTHDYICHYLKDIRHIDWVEDSTNTDTTFKRNAIRHELSQWSKAEIEHICALAERVQEVCLEFRDNEIFWNNR
ncbi:MAG: tRNA lysidine(34) synthetase TilS [Paludibacteraceae bacterium]|nr:tRNA lysidine(34) synthetase TilS [Paludibacteraceae bacterium]